MLEEEFGRFPLRLSLCGLSLLAQNDKWITTGSNLNRVERETGLEPATLALARRCSTTELFPPRESFVRESKTGYLAIPQGRFWPSGQSSFFFPEFLITKFRLICKGIFFLAGQRISLKEAS